MPDATHCPECGAPLPANWPKGLCSRCALQGALELTPSIATVPGDNQSLGSVAEQPGDRIGRYKLLEKIGEGGCGVVYMAEQEEPVRRRVALKVIKPGMDTCEVIARFEAERQALALMEHPHIAKVFDGGATETGRPYFVMELVRGLRITDYCDQKHLSTKERLTLFMQVCQAVQHAHQKGVIHRDLKPSNILVTVNDGVPVPKVIDFGIAKATGQSLTDKTFFTKFQQLIGTPAYMSPEQAELTSVDIDTRSDIYSLGVLLYELLTGRTPFDAKKLLQAGMEAMLRTIREQEPARPSARLRTLAAIEQTTVAQQRQTDGPRLVNLVRGDLDWIVMKALEKDRARRYETANGLALDVQRHLNNEPVLASPPTAAYRLQKLARRNRVAFLFGAAAVMALLLGSIISTRMFLKEREARASEGRLRRDAELREESSRIALLVTQRRFEKADKLLAGIPLDKPSIEVAAELRALGDWHAAKGRWPQAAERFASLVKVNQFDSPEVTSLDQLRLAAALLEAGDRRRYEQWRQSMVAGFTQRDAPLPASTAKACLLLPAPPDLLEPLAAESEPDTVRSGNARGVRLTVSQGVAWSWSDAKALLQYRCGNFAATRDGRLLSDNSPRLATCLIIEAMGTWRRKDYWRAMVTWTKGYALVQAGARKGLVPLTVRAEIFPGVGEPDYLHAPWYDWAVADLLLREWDEMFGEAEQSVSKTPGHTPTLPELAIVRAAGEWHSLRGEWSDAIRCAQYCTQTNQKDSLDHATTDYVNAALACLELGDEKSYLRLREEMTTRFKDAYEMAPWRTLEVGLARPIDDRVAAIFENLAAGLARRSRKETNDHWGLMLLSLHSYRKGDYASAVDLARQSLARFRDGARLPTAELSIILALCLNQQGNRSAALSELDRAESVIRTGFKLDYDVWHWRHWILVRLLLQEARGSIPQSPPP